MKNNTVSLLAVGIALYLLSRPKAEDREQGTVFSLGGFNFPNLGGVLSGGRPGRDTTLLPDVEFPEMGSYFQGIANLLNQRFSELPTFNLPDIVPGEFPPFKFPPIDIGGIDLPIDIPDIPSMLYDATGLPKSNELLTATKRATAIGVRQYAGLALTGEKIPGMIMPFAKQIKAGRAGVIKVAIPAVKVGLAKIAPKIAPAVVTKVASRAVPVVGWGLLAADIASDAARLFGANMPESLGFSGVISAITGSNPIENWMRPAEAQTLTTTPVVTKNAVGSNIPAPYYTPPPAKVVVPSPVAPKYTGEYDVPLIYYTPSSAIKPYVSV